MKRIGKQLPSHLGKSAHILNSLIQLRYLFKVHRLDTLIPTVKSVVEMDSWRWPLVIIISNLLCTSTDIMIGVCTARNQGGQNLCCLNHSCPLLFIPSSWRQVVAISGHYKTLEVVKRTVAISCSAIDVCELQSFQSQKDAIYLSNIWKIRKNKNPES